jgi:hypothetical protein
MEKTYYLSLTNNLIINIWHIILLMYKLRKMTYASVFVGNLKSIYIRTILLFIDYKQISTYDDGFANLTNSFLNTPESKYLEFFFKLLSPKLQYKNVSKNIKTHYTIFDLYKNNNMNKYKKTVKLTLFNNQSKIIATDVVKRILLTSPLSEYNILSLSIEQKLYQKVIKENKITDIIMHPSEKKEKINGTNIIKNILIAEESIGKIAKESKVIVYGFYSTALINLLSNENVKIVNIHVNEIHNDKNAIVFDSFNIDKKQISINNVK